MDSYYDKELLVRINKVLGSIDALKKEVDALTCDIYGEAYKAGVYNGQKVQKEELNNEEANR